MERVPLRPVSARAVESKLTDSSVEKQATLVLGPKLEPIREPKPEEIIPLLSCQSPPVKTGVLSKIGRLLRRKSSGDGDGQPLLRHEEETT